LSESHLLGFKLIFIFKLRFPPGVSITRNLITFRKPQNITFRKPRHLKNFANLDMQTLLVVKIWVIASASNNSTVIIREINGHIL
jgi:hypothetical protein